MWDHKMWNVYIWGILWSEISLILFSGVKATGVNDSEETVAKGSPK